MNEAQFEKACILRNRMRDLSAALDAFERWENWLPGVLGDYVSPQRGGGGGLGAASDGIKKAWTACRAECRRALVQELDRVKAEFERL